MLELGEIAAAIAKLALPIARKELSRNEAVVRLLKQLNLDPEHPGADFSTVYRYALVEYGVGKPEPVLEIFRRQEIQEIFRQALDRNDPALFAREGDRFLRQNEESIARLREVETDARREFYEFAARFVKVANRTRSPAEVLTHRSVRSLRQELAEIQDRLKRLPTLEGLRTEMARLAGEAGGSGGQGEGSRGRAFALSQQIRGWFETLGYPFEAYEAWEEDSFEWVLNVPVRRGRYDRVLVKGVDGIVGLAHVRSLRRAVAAQNADEGWLVAARRIGQAARAEVAKPGNEDLACYTLDETIDQDADFGAYLDWLERDIQQRGIDRRYVPLACTTDEIDPKTQQKLGVSRYDDIDSYIDDWLEDPAKEHVSVLGEFGTGKTWFALHYAWKALQAYRQAKREGRSRPRLPLVVPLRDYAKAVSVESLFSEFFFRKHEIPIPGYSAFEQLNRMGKLLLIFDGFDEMAARVDRQATIDNFWELAKTVVPGAKVILTCRTEHFPEAREGRSLLNAELQASVENLTGETPQFEVLDLEKFSDDRIRQVLSFAARPETVERVMGNPQLLDLARRPVMSELILEALPDIEAGKPADMSRIYLYAAQRKMARDIKQERTFTSMADKLYFLCELSWEMLSSDRMRLNYREFPDRIRRLFGAVVREQRDLDHWRYDMMGQTMLTRNAAGDYAPAHRSLLEFFVAYKLAAELGVLAEDFVAIARQHNFLEVGAAARDYPWSAYFSCEAEGKERKRIAPLQQFEPEDWDTLRERWGQAIWPKAVMDLLVLMVRRDESALRRLQGLLQATRGKTADEVKYFGGNVISLLAETHQLGLQDLDLSRAVLRGANLVGAWLQRTNLTGANLEGSEIIQLFGVPNGVTYSPDGETLITGHDDGTLRFWGVRDRRILRSMQAHQGAVRAVAYCPSEQQLASCSVDRTVKIWDARNGECLHTLKGHRDTVRSVVYHPSGQQLASGSNDSTVRIWDASSGKCLHTLEGHRARVRSVAYCPSKQQLASGSDDSTVKIWDVDSGVCLRTLEGHRSRIRSVAYRPSGQQLASSSADRTIKIWDARSGECLRTLEGHQSQIRALAYRSDGQQLASGSDDGIVKIWDANTGKCLQTLEGHRDRVRRVVYHPDGRQLTSASADGTVKIWDTHEAECLHSFEGYPGTVMSVAYHPDGQQLASGSGDRTVKIWDPSSGICLQSLEGHQGWVVSVVYRPDGQQLASGSDDCTVKIWDASTEEHLHTLAGHQFRIWSVSYHPDGQQLASGSTDRAVKIWDVESGECLHTLDGHQGRVWSVSYHPNGQQLASGSADLTIKIWDAWNGKCLHTLTEHQDSIMSLTYSPSGKYIVSGSWDGTVKIWDVCSTKCLYTLTEHQGSVLPLVCPNEQQFASGSADRTIKIWDIHTGQCLHTLIGHTEWVEFLAYHPNGQQLASGSADGTIKIWDVTTGQCLSTIRNSPYADLDLTGATGLTEGQRLSMKALGAIERSP